MSDDPVAVIAVWFLGLYAIALATPLIVAVVLVLLILAVVRRAFILARNLLEGDPHERELRRTMRERNAAIRDIVQLHQRAQRQLYEIAGQPARQRAFDRRRS